MNDLTIGQRIAAKRKELGLSQIDLGDKMGVSRQSVSKWEADAAIPEVDKLIALSKLFHVSVGWLLGVETDETQAEAPEQTFNNREWEIIDRLTQEKPRLPKWFLPLAAGVTAVSLIAVLLSGAALYASRSHSRNLASISQSVANLTTSLGAALPDVQVLEDYSFLAQPSPDLNECTFVFSGVPACHEAGSTAELFIVLGGETVVRQECQWDGTSYKAAFTLPTYNGYTASFRLTGMDGIVHTSQVYDDLLYNLMDRRSFGTVSVEFGSIGCDGRKVMFDEMRIIIEVPDILRDSPGIWAKCDLVVLGDGRELGRTDLVNRSQYSKKVNFSGTDVDFYTKNQSIAIGDVAGITELEVLLCCELTTGMQMQKVVDTINCVGWR